jgi:hypothetical protein
MRDQARPQAKPANPVVDPQVVDNTECPPGLLRPLTALMSHEHGISKGIDCHVN